jgi:hypothetical protein
MADSKRGFDLCAASRDSDRLARLPLVMLSSRTYGADTTRSLWTSPRRTGFASASMSSLLPSEGTTDG